jgi:inositol hexakisphosphate/diphosphoinositol-pentakisphosphate kinase
MLMIPYLQFTHSARYQSKDLGENFGKDISIMSKEVLKNVKVQTPDFIDKKDFLIARPDLYILRTPCRSSAEVFAAALLGQVHSTATSSGPPTPNHRPSSGASVDAGDTGHHSSRPLALTSYRKPIELIVRKDLLDDSNAAKDLIDDVKKRLKILLRPGEPEKRPELIWPKSMKKEPVEVVKVLHLFCVSFGL